MLIVNLLKSSRGSALFSSIFQSLTSLQIVKPWRKIKRPGLPPESFIALVFPENLNLSPELMSNIRVFPEASALKG
jgi:hypothetical protein